MQALIFAAGLGERMRPLTDVTPKPLLEVGGKPLIVWHLEKLAQLGVKDVVVNTSWLAEQFPGKLGDGSQWNLNIRYSEEPGSPLETGGGLLNAWNLLDVGQPMLAVNGDVWTDFDFTEMSLSENDLAHLVMVPNPAHNANGDFSLNANRIESESDIPRDTFAGIGIYRYGILDNWRETVGDVAGVERNPPRFKLAPLLRKAMREGRVSGQLHEGLWTDVGTPERLRELDAQIKAAR